MEDYKRYRAEGSNLINSELKELVLEEEMVLESHAIANVRGPIIRRSIQVLEKGIRCDLGLLEDPEFQKQARDFYIRTLQMQRRESRKNTIRLTVLSATGVILLIYIFLKLR
jgi:hypothetical protein